MKTEAEFQPVVVNVADNSTTVWTGETLLRGVYVNTALSAHDLPIKNGSTTIFTIPASTVAGTVFPFFDTFMSTSIVVDPDDAATGSITVVFKPNKV